MNTTIIDTKDVIRALKRVKKEKKLSLDKILVLMNQKDESTAVSKTTLARVFRNNSESEGFNYENTIRPIANALLDMEEIEAEDTIDTQAIKSILKLKKDIIDELEGNLKGYEDLKVREAHYQETLELLNKQITYKDERIDKLLCTNERLSLTIERLTEQLLSCPCRVKNEG